MLRDFLLCWYMGQSYPRRPQAKIIEYFIGILPPIGQESSFDERQESIMACASACRMKTERNNASFLINEQSNLCVAVQIKIGSARCYSAGVPVFGIYHLSVAECGIGAHSSTKK